MSTEAIHTAELLSAYLSGDVAPDERMALERLLAGDVLAQEQLFELRELSAYLKAGNEQVSPEALEALRRAVFHKIQEKQIKALVTVSVTGDLSEKEKQQVEIYLTAHPGELKDQRQAAALSALLSAGNAQAGGGMSEKLRAKLSAKLPKGAMVSKPATVPVNERRERPSLRVFVPQETPWTKRLIVMGGIAAAVALVAGAGTLWIHFYNKPGANVVVKENPSTGHDEAPINKGGDPGIAQQHDVAPPVHEPPVHAPPVLPNVVTQQNPPLNQNVPVQPDVNVNPVQPLKVVDVTVPRDVNVSDPKTTQKNNGAQIAQPSNNVVQPKTNVPDNAGNPALNNNAVVQAPNTNSNVPVNETNNGSGGRLIPQINPNQPGIAQGVVPSANVPNNVVAPNTNNAVKPATQNDPAANNPGLAPTAVVTTIPPQEGMGVVGAVKGDLARVTADGIGKAINKLDTVPSGATIETNEKTHVSLVLPGDGRLYINSGSSLKVTFNGHNTSIELAAGEIYYKAPADGTLTLTANSVTVSAAVEADVSLAGQLTASNFGTKSFEVSTSGAQKHKVNVFSGGQASTAPDGSETIKKDPNGPQTGVWRADVLLDGGLKAGKAGGKSRRI